MANHPPLPDLTGFYEEVIGDLSYRRWPDGVEQVAFSCLFHRAGFEDPDFSIPFITVERVLGPESRRKRWTIINRQPQNSQLNNSEVYGPVFAKGLHFRCFIKALAVYETVFRLHTGIDPYKDMRINKRRRK
jgi:hypothetical protein